MITMSILAALLGAAPIQTGDRAPDFTLPDTDGSPVTLSKLLERGPVILAFYPKAFTPGCTQQNEHFRDQFSKVTEKGAQVVGISVDSVETQRKFKAEHRLPFPLLMLSDASVASLTVILSVREGSRFGEPG